MQTCWCDSGSAAADCCEPFLSRSAYPQTAEQLMRARYSAFITQNADFLRASWHPATCPATLQFNPDQRWLGLKILDTDQGGAEDDEGEVRFAARYKIHGKGHRQEETSSFARLAGNWVYVGGVVK